MTIKGSNIDDIYFHLCERIIKLDKLPDGNREFNNAVIELDHVSDDNNILSIRNMSYEYLMAELLWYFAGRHDVKFIGTFASLWNRISDDGVTNNSAYGYLMKYKHGFNQIEKVIELLQKDPLSRRAVININVPNENVIETKDEPCTIALQFLIRDDKLNCTAIMRSNDIWFGLPYDVAFFTELQKYIAFKLGIKTGTYTHFATSLHLYERDEVKLKNVLSKKYESKPFTFNRLAFYMNYDFISYMIDKAIDNGDNIKDMFKYYLKKHEIITEDSL